jgi:hypothetical protein
MTAHLKLLLVSTTLLTAWGCVSHRYVVKRPLFPADSWEKLDAQAAGTEITVLLQTGLEISGSFQGSSPGEVTLTTDTGSEINIAKADVRRVSAIAADELDNGILWGVVFGGLMGVLSLQGGNAASSAGAFAVFTGLPILYDWSHQEHEVLYGGP